MRNLAVMPIGSDLVLKAVATLVAGTAAGEVFEIDPTLDPGGLAEAVQLLMKWTGGVEQIEQKLAALERAGMIVRDRESVRLIYPSPPPGADGEFVLPPTPANSPGRKPAWMTPEQWAIVLEEHRTLRQSHARLRAALEAGKPVQTAMLMPFTGGSKPRVDIPIHIPAADMNGGNETAFSPKSSGVAASRTTTTTTNQKLNDSEVVVVVPSPADAQEFAADISNPISGNISADICDPISRIISAGKSGPISPQAEQLAQRMLSGLRHLPRDENAAMPAAVQGALAEGYSASQLDKWIADMHARAADMAKKGGGKAIRGVRYCLKALLDHVPDHQRPAPGEPAAPAATGPGPAAVTDRRILDVPEYAAEAQHVQRTIGRLLDLVEAPDSAGRRNRLSSIRSHSPAVFRLVGRHHPDILELFGDDRDEDS